MLVTKLHYHRMSKRLMWSLITLQSMFLVLVSSRSFSLSRVRGHGNKVLVTNKKDVSITQLEQIGHYAVRITFSDHHNTGLYSWDYLIHLAKHHDQLWQSYNQLKQANATREPQIAIKITH